MMSTDTIRAYFQSLPIAQAAVLLVATLLVASISLADVAAPAGTLVTTSADGEVVAELDPRLEEAERRRIEAVERALPATVSIFVPGGGGGGSGVLISPDGYALTNFHVSSPAGNYMRCGLSDGRIYDAVIIGIDPVGDLALIRLLGRNDFPYAEMADSRKAQVGQWCLVIGNPFLLATNLQPTVTWGILSGVGRYQYPSGTLLEYADCLQTDASINPGNSGGPLFDDSGRLLGIVGRASFEKRGRVNVGVGYAISINQAKNFLGDLHSGRILDHATLGATVATDPDGGARVSNILDSSDAYRRGLRYGHTVVEIDGRSVNTANEVQNVLATLPPQWRVPLVYMDRGERKSTLVRLANLHGSDELLEKMAAALPPPPPAPEPPKEPDSQQDNDNGDDAKPDGDTPKLPDLKKLLPQPRQPQPGQPRGRDGGDKNVEIPPAVAAVFEARRGFANYFPNRIKQQEMLDHLRRQFPTWDADATADAAQPAGPVWKIEGKTDNDQSLVVRLVVSDGAFEMMIGDKTISATNRSELYDAITSTNVSGILACLDAWRSLLVRGTDGFGECFYRGQVPLLGQRPLRDCLIGVSGELEATWLVHPESTVLEAIEMTADRDDDPAELHITWGDDRSKNPTHLELRYGTLSVLKLKIDAWEITATGELK